VKIALIGYGKMGKLIEEMALAKGHQIGLIIHEHNLQDFTTSNLQQCDVAIEFTSPEAVVANIQRCADAQVPVVVGTTGWYNQFSAVQEYIKAKNSALLHATNFSLGVNLFFKLNTYLAELMNPFLDQYQVQMQEIHHTQKLDAPSGTAISLAEQVIQNQEVYKEWYLKGNQAKNNAFEIEALRIPDVPGTHSVTYQNDIDKIDITHTAHNRKGFAAGAIIAAEWLAGKKGIYTMQDVLNA
jgi:4-hydroxy-tetrahydrodipicolinate reductase